MTSISKGKKAGKKTAAALLSAVYLMSLSPLVHAETLEEQRDAHIEKAEKAQQKKNEIESEIEGLSEEKRVIDEAADEATKAYKDVRKELDATEERIDANEDKLKVLNKDFAAKRSQLAKRVRDIYINGQINYLDVLFGAKDFQDFFTRMDLLKRVIQQDYDLVQVVFAEKTAIETSQKELEKDKAAKEKLVSAASDRKKEAEKKQAAKQAITGAHYQRESRGIQGSRADDPKQPLSAGVACSFRRRNVQLADFWADHVAFRLARSSDHRREPLPFRHRHRRRLW